MFQRKTGHIWNLKNKTSHNRHFQYAWNKHGIDEFEFSIIEFCPEEILDWKEEYWIQKYKSNERKFGYNLSIGGGRHNQSEKTIESIKKYLTGRRQSKETCEKVSMARIGIKFPETHKQNLSKSAKEKWKNPVFREKHLSILAKIREIRYKIEKFYCA